jgi:hypothetical protein
VKYRDENGREYILVDGTVVDIVLYFSIALVVALTLLAFFSAKLP